MNSRAPTQTKTTPKPSFAPVSTGLLRRKCACGNSAGLTGKCTECENKRLTLQRRSTNEREPDEVPPIVHEVLRSPKPSRSESPGQPVVTTSSTTGYSSVDEFSQVTANTTVKITEFRGSPPEDDYLLYDNMDGGIPDAGVPLPAGVPAPAPPASPPAPPAPPAPVAAAPLTVTVPRQISGSSSPAGMANRIPPRVDTPVAVRISGWFLPMLDVTLSIEGAGGGNGTVTINGAATVDLNSDATVQLRGVNQTAVGKAGNLRLVAHQAGTRLAASDGFSVSAIPQNWSISFIHLFTGASRGFEVQDSWESDSGVVADLNQTEISEEVQYDPGTGVFAGVGTNNSGYLRGDVFTTDKHRTPVALLTGPGSIVAHQTSKFKDNRSGSVDIPMKNSGYLISRLAVLAPIRPIFFGTAKAGSSTTANGIASAAGSGSVTKVQSV